VQQQQQQQQHAIAIAIMPMPMPPLNVQIMNMKAECAYLQQMKHTHTQTEQEMHEKHLAVLMHQVCHKDAPIIPPPPLLVFAFLADTSHGDVDVDVDVDGVCDVGHNAMVEEPNITSYDVLAGRGNRTNNHVGNLRFRELLTPFKRLYLQQTTKKHVKARMCAVLVNYVRTQCCPPGRFLEKDPNKPNMWVEIGDKKARKKAGQALREDATEIRAEWGMMKPGASKEVTPVRFTASYTKKEEEESDPSPPESPPKENLSAANDAAAAAYEAEQEQELAHHEMTKEEAEASEDHLIDPMPMPLNNLPLKFSAPSMMTSRAVSMASDFGGSSSRSMMSSATAAMGNLSTVTDVHANMNMIAVNQDVDFDLLDEVQEEYHQHKPAPRGDITFNINDEQHELIMNLKQKKRLLMSQRKHRPQPSLTTTTIPTPPEKISSCLEKTETPSPLVGLYMPQRTDASNFPRLDLDVSNRTIQSLACAQDNNTSANTNYNDSDFGILDIIDNSINSDQEEPTSRLHSKTYTPSSNQRLSIVNNMNILTPEDEYAVAVAAATLATSAAAFGHESGSSYRRPNQASASLTRSMKAHANNASTNSGHHTITSTRSSFNSIKQKRNSSICMHDLSMSIDDASRQAHNTSKDRVGADQTATKSMFDSSMTMSIGDHFGNGSNSALSSTSWNTSHGTMSLADFSFSQILLQDLADDFFEGSDGDDDVDAKDEEESNLHSSGESNSLSIRMSIVSRASIL
jgi:hypothetical protein